MLARKFNTVVRQQYDFSCGSAALATLLHYHYGLPRSETEVFTGMWREGDQAQIRRVGFSLLDMKRWLASRGIAADGYKVSLAKIAETGIPGIALIAVRNYRHFVVVKGVSHDEVLLGDPSTGVQVMPRARFEQAWNGVYFVLTEDQGLAKSRFNRERQWAAFARAPMGGRFSEPVSQQALLLTAPFYGDMS
jgi:predicted double-glycine peptidase